MSNHYSHAALPYPIRNARYTIAIPYLDADGDPTDPTTPDTEISKDAGSFADCTEEVSTITGSNGMGYITLTSSEMDASLVCLAAKVASGPKATLAMLQPRILPVLHNGTAQAGANTSITLASTAPAYDLIGCIVRTTGGTGGGSGGNQARVITAYDTSTKVATISPAWETNPSSDTTYDILLTDMASNSPVTRALRPATDGRTLNVASTGEAEADTIKVSGDSTAADNLEAACDGTGYNVGGGSVVAASVTGNVGGNIGGTVPNSAGVTTLLGLVTEARMGALTDWIDGGRLDLILDAIAGDVVNLDGAAMRGTDGAALASAWTATRAGYIDLLNTYLDAAVSSRLATAGYTAPDNTNIGNIITAINHATYGLNALLTAINSRLATASYTAPDNASITAILEDTATTIPALIAALNNLSSAQAQAAAAAALTAYDPPTKSELDSAVSPLATAAAVAAMRGADDDTLKTLSDQIDGISGGGGDATAANQATIIGHLEDMKGATFSETTDSLEAIRNRGDVAWLTGGGASGSNVVEITVTDGEDVPIQEVKVEIWNSDESVLVTYGTTDAEGVVNLTANDGTYRVRMIKGGWSFTTQNLTVDGAESVTYTGESRSVPGPASPDVCRLYEYLFLPDGSPPSTLAARAATLRIFTLPFDDDAAVYSGTAIDGTYNATTGLIYWDVVQGAVVRVTIGVFGVDLILTVPSESTARISNIE